MNAAKWAAACLAFTLSLFSQAPTNSLVAHFKLDGGLRDETGTVTSGVNGGATFGSDRFGRSSAAAYFDGRSYINFGDVTILNGATEATWSFWIRTTQRAPQSGYVSVLRKDRAWLPLQGAQDIPPGTWRSPMYFEGKPDWSGPYYGSLPQISDGTWHMFTVIFSAGSLRTYIDGSLIQAISTYGTVPTGALQTSTNPFSLGASLDYGSPTDWYIGSLDDLRIYRRALSATEVAQLYASESAPATVPGTPQFSDAFAGTVVNSARWSIVPAFSDSSVVQENGALVLTNRGKVLSVDSFSGTVDVTFKFQFTGSSADVLRFTTRTDGVTTNASKEFDRGVKFGVQPGSSGNINLMWDDYPRGGGTFAMANYPIQVNQVYTFRAVDDGQALSLYVDNMTIPVLRASSALVLGKQIAFNNREGAGGGSGVSAGSQVKISAFSVNMPSAVAPAISVQPVAQTVSAGSTATFSVVATGTPSPSYQWLKGGSAIAGATGSSLVLAAITSANEGSYAVAVTNAAGTVTSLAVSLTIAPGNGHFYQVVTVPAGITWPEAKARAEAAGGYLATLTSASEATYVYQLASQIPAAWFLHPAGDTLGPWLGGRQLPNSKEPDGGWYWITNEAWSYTNWAYGEPSNNNQGTSEDSLLFVGRGSTTGPEWNDYPGTGKALAYVVEWSSSSPVILENPSSPSLFAGQRFDLSTTASGSPPLTYQWLKNGTPVTGATSSTYSVSATTAADAGLYTVAVSNAYGSVTSSPATVTVTTPQPQAPVFTLQPASVAAPAGSSRTFSIAVSGYPIPALQWLKNGVRLTGQTRETLTLSNISTADAATYTCEATNTSGTTVSQSAVLAVGQAPVVAKAVPITGIEAKIGDPLRIDLPPLGGTGPFSYRWTRDSTVIAVSGSSLQIGALTAAGSGLYSCLVSNAYGSVQIDRVRVTLIEAPRITTQPQSATIAASGSATFRVTVSGTPAPTYQWYRNELPLSGQTATQITVSGSPATQTVGGYYCVVTNRAGSVRSATAGLTVSAGTTTTPSITRTVQQQEIGRSVMLADSDTVFVTGLGQVFASYSTFSASGSGTDRTTTGALYYNYELRPRAGSAKDYEANFVRRTPLGMVDYGNFVVSLPTNDTDGNGINDAFEYRQNGTATALGSGYDYANGTPFSIELRFTRAAGEVKGRYAAKTTTLTGISAEVSGDFYVSGPNGIRIGSTTYVRGASNVMNVSLAPDTTLTNNTGTPYSGSFGFTVTDRDTVAYNAFDLTSNTGVKYSVRAGTLKRNGRVYGGTLSYVDGRTSTAFADYVSSYFTITDPNDADGDGIPDLTDDLPAPPALASFSGTAQTLQTGARLEFTATAQGTGIFVWKKDGVVIRTSASTSADTLTIPSVARTDTGSYWVELTNGGGTSASAVVPVVVSANDALPIITGQPVAAQVSTGSNLILTVDALAGSTPRYQWRKDGVDIPGATGSSYGKVSLNTTEAGHYSVLVTNDAGATVSQLASVSYSASNEAIPLLSNLSVRTQLQPNVPLIVGAVVSGTGKPLLMRAAGPALEKFGLQGVRESEMKLYDPSQNVIATKQGWDPSLDTIFPLVGAFPFTAGSKDSAVVRSMGGAFTLHTVAQSAGAALVELYDATGGTGQRLVNLSVRTRVGADSDILIVGLAVGGVGRINLLLRAVGPTLGSFGVTGTLDDPKITIYGPSGAVLAANDNWSADLTPVFARVGAFGLAAGSRDAALLFSADAGSVYTVHVAGVNNTTGEALVEVYEVP